MARMKAREASGASASDSGPIAAAPPKPKAMSFLDELKLKSKK
jgi:hypothetical protein